MGFELPDLIEGELEVEMGGIITFSKDGSLGEQVGYSTSINGDPLYGLDEGDWQECWYVIGFETLLGDPIFINLNKGSLPVYTAPHGMGEWIETCIAETYTSFISTLSFIEKSLQSGEIENKNSTLQHIKSLIGSGEINFWSLLIYSNDH
ncbi:hypothetical protein [Microbulbifer sp. THAF38]|uniref:hypothetical protein n=1 Tax=unclassified Microbulbifer TaxID=2619833 RepID=UPI0012693257|nr:hypothetical protein [Microbulbifer sp. THAF38]QFT56177.1 hypothetical protein FIU95_16630 [Microbulbifer sp. THAF38]